MFLMSEKEKVENVDLSETVSRTGLFRSGHIRVYGKWQSEVSEDTRLFPV